MAKTTTRQNLLEKMEEAITAKANTTNFKLRQY